MDTTAGETVIKEGSGGASFYVIENGEADVTIKGDHRATLTAGDYFGEIALLRDVPRTATVTATTATRLFTLERADFLAAVTGHVLAEAAAEDVVGARLAERGLPA